MNKKKEINNKLKQKEKEYNENDIFEKFIKNYIKLIDLKNINKNKNGL